VRASFHYFGFDFDGTSRSFLGVLVSNILSEEVWGRESSRVGFRLTQNLGFCLESKVSLFHYFFWGLIFVGSSSCPCAEYFV
jgi:hypothetical protein